MSEIRAFKCDAEGCVVVSAPWEAKVRFYPTPRSEQSASYRDRKHYCPEHYPFLYCAACGQRLRPYQAKAKDWPSTVAKAKSNPPLCSNCAVPGNENISTRPDVSPEVVASAQRVVRSYLNDQDALVVLVALGID